MISFSEQDNIRWDYNGLDVIYTLEVAEVLEDRINKSSDKLKSFYNFQIKEIAPALIDIMNHGIKIDLEKKKLLHEQLTILLKEVEEKLNYLIGEPFNPKSQPQIKAVFKELCGITPIKDKKTKSESFSSISMFEYRELYPEYRALIDLILEYRSIGVFLRTFVSAEVDEDGRMRTSYNVAGTKTYRLSSRKNAFGKGANLANTPSKGKIDLKYSLSSIEDEEDEEDSFVTGDYEGITKLPNCKEFFIPDEGYNFFNADYCLTEDHEVLTSEGWLDLKTYVETNCKLQIACWDFSGNITFSLPKEYIKIDYKGDLFHFEGKTSLVGSSNHRQPFLSNYSCNRVEKFKNLFESKAGLNYIHSGKTIETENSLSKDYLRLLVAMQADGCFVSDTFVRFSFKKERKILRLIGILEKLDIDYEVVETQADYTNVNLKSKFIIEMLLKDLGREKNFPSYFYTLSYENISTIVEELRYWDGKAEKLDNFTYYSTNKHNINLVQGLCVLINKYSSLYVEKAERNVLAKKDLYCLYISNKITSQLRTTKKSKTYFEGNLYCLHTETGFFVVRRNNKVTITGNSGADAMIVAWDSDCKWLKNFFLNENKKLYIYIAENYFQREITTSDPWYKKFKQFVHLTNYGGMEEKAAASSGMPRKDAKSIRQWYFKLNQEIPDWHKRIASEIKSRGYIENIFGARGWFLNKESPTLLNQAYAWVPQCVPLDHEVLTKDGWKTIKSIAATEEIAVWDENRNITFEVPKQWNFAETNSLIHLESLDYYCTDNHTLPYYNFGDTKLRTCIAKTKPKSAQIPRNGIYLQGSVSLSKEQIGLLVAFQADGSYNSARDCLQFEFKKARKIERLENILNSLGIVYTKSVRTNRSNCTLFYIPKISRYLDPTRKFFGNWLLDLTQDSLLYFLEELQYWDGTMSKENQIWYTSNIKVNTDWVITIASLCGKKAYYISPDIRAVNTNHRVLINLSDRGKNAITTSKRIYKQCKVACPTTSTGFFLIKYNDKISVTGNSSIAILVNKGLCNIHYKEKKEDISVLMQIHDALAGQYRKSLGDKEAEERICKHMSVELPYKDKLVIPVDFSFSEKSYGGCK